MASVVAGGNFSSSSSTRSLTRCSSAVSGARSIGHRSCSATYRRASTAKNGATIVTLASTPTSRSVEDGRRRRDLGVARARTSSATAVAQPHHEAEPHGSRALAGEDRLQVVEDADHDRRGSASGSDTTRFHGRRPFVTVGEQRTARRARSSRRPGGTGRRRRRRRSAPRTRKCAGMPMPTSGTPTRRPTSIARRPDVIGMPMRRSRAPGRGTSCASRSSRAGCRGSAPCRTGSAHEPSSVGVGQSPASTSSAASDSIDVERRVAARTRRAERRLVERERRLGDRAAHQRVRTARSTHGRHGTVGYLPPHVPRRSSRTARPTSPRSSWPAPASRRPSPSSTRPPTASAELLRAAGLQPGDHVAICMENHARYLEVVWGCHYAGLVYTARSSRLTSGELEYIINDCGARCSSRRSTRPTRPPRSSATRPTSSCG